MTRKRIERKDNKSRYGRAGRATREVVRRALPRRPLQSDPAPSISPSRSALGARHAEQLGRGFQRAGPSPGPPLA